jgi:hypothetical protein
MVEFKIIIYSNNWSTAKPLGKKVILYLYSKVVFIYIIDIQRLTYSLIF